MDEAGRAKLGEPIWSGGVKRDGEVYNGYGSDYPPAAMRLLKRESFWRSRHHHAFTF